MRIERGFSTFSSMWPNYHTEGSWPANCTTSPIRQPLHRAEIKTTFNNATCTAIGAKADPVCCQNAKAFEAQYMIMHRSGHFPH